MTRNNAQQALRLYMLNTKVSAAVMTDLHYIEVALRNKFGYEWFKDAGSREQLGVRSATHENDQAALV